MPSLFRPCLALLTAALLLAQPSFAFNTPLSDEAVREAYFLGQRRDESMAAFLNKYTKVLPPPKSGPHIHSVTFLTPFALLVQHSSRQSNYSAQQAAKEHHPDQEMVSIQIEILFTASYGPFIATPTSSRTGSPLGYRLRSSDFWRTFICRVFDGQEEITTENVIGEPQYSCSEGGCSLIGAIVHLDFPASAFTSDTGTIEVTPPEGEPISVDFDLSSLR